MMLLAYQVTNLLPLKHKQGKCTLEQCIFYQPVHIQIICYLLLISTKSEVTSIFLDYYAPPKKKKVSFTERSVNASLDVEQKIKAFHQLFLSWYTEFLNIRRWYNLCYCIQKILFNSTPLLEKAMAPHSSTLAWRIPWTEEPGGLQSMGSLRVGDDWATSLSLFTFMHWRGKWQPTPVFLPGESQGWGAW